MRTLVQIMGMVFYPLIVHLLIKFDATWLAVLGLVATSIVYLVLAWSVRRQTGAHWSWLVLYLVLGGFGTVNLFSGTHYALFIPPVVINLGLAIVFGSSLRAGATPLVTRMMRFEYEGRDPPAPVARYARRLTIVWVVYFTLTAAVCAVLAASAPLDVWSLYANVLNYVFAVMLVFAQFLYRAWRYRQYGRVMPWDTLRGMARLKTGRQGPAGHNSPGAR